MASAEFLHPVRGLSSPLVGVNVAPAVLINNHALGLVITTVGNGRRHRFGGSVFVVGVGVGSIGRHFEQKRKG